MTSTNAPVLNVRFTASLSFLQHTANVRNPPSLPERSNRPRAAPHALRREGPDRALGGQSLGPWLPPSRYSPAVLCKTSVRSPDPASITELFRGTSFGMRWVLILVKRRCTRGDWSSGETSPRGALCGDLGVLLRATRRQYFRSCAQHFSRGSFVGTLRSPARRHEPGIPAADASA